MGSAVTETLNGVPGVVIRLGRGFNDVMALDDYQVRAGTAVPDVKVARVAQEAAIAGLAFLRPFREPILARPAVQNRRLAPIKGTAPCWGLLIYHCSCC